MADDAIGGFLKGVRKRLGFSQAQLASRCGVSVRLIAEVERGERPNVSLATVLRLLGEIGVKVQLSDATGCRIDLGDPKKLADARAAVRRANWSGRQLQLAQEGEHDPTPAGRQNRFAAVGLVSQQAVSVSRGKVSRLQTRGVTRSPGRKLGKIA